MPDVALLHVGARPPAASDDDARLIDALRSRGASVELYRFDDPSVDWSAVTVAVVRSADPSAVTHPGFLPAAQHVAASTNLWNPPEVLRWNTHRSYLLELEERGAPVVPTAWTAQGDRIDLQRLLIARGWDAVTLVSPVRGGDARAVRVGRDGVDVAAGQRHLDALLKVGDAMMRSSPQASDDVAARSVVVIDGEVSHAVRHGPTNRPDDVSASPVDAETDALTRWIIDAIGVELLYASVRLLDDELGLPQLVEVDATAPAVHLGAAHPAAAERFADAILRRGRR